MFAPFVLVLRNWLGSKAFNSARGKAIALHAHVITTFCNRVGFASIQRQSFIRLARDNGKRLGLLA